MRKIGVLVGLMALACGGDVTSEPGIGTVPGDPAATTPGMEMPVSAPVDPVASMGTFPPTLQGMCDKFVACGCVEGVTTADACVQKLGKPAQMQIWDGGAAACTVALSCDQICGAAQGAENCVQETAAKLMADEKARHDITMGIINGFPTGGPCASGQTMVTDSYGNFVRCQ